MSPSNGADHGWGSRAWHFVRHNVAHHCVAVVVVACLVTLTKPLWAPVDDQVAILGQAVARVALAWTAEGEAEPLSATAVVKLGESRFTSFYAGVEPLDRCQLTDDLRVVLEQVQPPLRTLAVDFDLAPTVRGEMPPNWDVRDGADPAQVLAGGQADDCMKLVKGERPAGAQENVVPHEVERTCQCQLNGLLLQHAGRLVLMQPRERTHPLTRQRVQAWTSVMTGAGAQFADVGLESTRGIYRLRKPSDSDLPLFADVVFSRAAGAAQTLTTETATPIPFHTLPLLRWTGTDYLLGDPELPGALAGARTVLLGSGYTDDDRFITAVGKLDGVDIHAAMSVCKPPTVTGRQVQNLAEFGFKLLVGMLLLGPMLHCFWARYYADVRASPAGASAWVTRGAYLWLVAMALAVFGVFLVLTTVFPLAMGWVLASPCAVPMLSASFVVGLAVEAAVVQGHEVAHQNMGKGAGAEVGGDATAQPVRRWVHSAVLWAGGALLLGLTLKKLLVV
jgi:hypothetical protein